MAIQCLRNGYDRFKGAVQWGWQYWDKHPHAVNLTLLTAYGAFAYLSSTTDATEFTADYLADMSGVVIAKAYAGTAAMLGIPEEASMQQIRKLVGPFFSSAMIGVALYESISYLREQISTQYADRVFSKKFRKAMRGGNKELAIHYGKKLSSSQQHWALIQSIKEGEVEIAKEIIGMLSPEELSFPAKKGGTPLHWAITKKQVEIAEMLIDKMTLEQLCMKDKYDRYLALHGALDAGQVEIAKMLIDKMTPEQLCVRQTNGSTVLIHVIDNGPVEIGKILINKLTSEQLCMKDKRDGSIALHRAIIMNPDEMLTKMLIDKMTPEQLCIKTWNGLTPLHFAISRNQLEIVKALVPQLPQAAFLKDALWVGTPLELAEARGRVEMANLIRTAMQRPNLAAG